jgi:hypothetical protein
MRGSSMLEKTKIIMTLIFTVCFLGYSILVGKFYEKFHVSREVWIGLCGLFTLALVISFIIDLFFSESGKGRDDRQP